MKKFAGQLIVWHRYLGIFFCLFFALWFCTGIVMIYATMPELTEAERLAHLPPLDLSRAKLTPAQALSVSKIRQTLLRTTIGVVDGRPVYRFLPRTGRWVSVFADTGEVLRKVDVACAARIAAPYAKADASSLTAVRELRDVDQWTVYPASRSYLPFQLLVRRDGLGSEYYVSEATGSLFLKTTRRTRLLAWCGAIPHWWYIRSLRANTMVWRTVMMIVSTWGIIMCSAGILAAALRFSPSRRYRFPGQRRSFISYVGWKRWHYYFGSFIGLATFTWILSGLFTLNPGQWSPGPTPSQAEVTAFAGGDLNPAAFTLTPMEAALRFKACFSPSEMEMVMFADQPYYLARDRNSDVRLLPAQVNGKGCIREVPSQELLRAASRAANNAPLMDSTFLRAYDTYYYDRTYHKPLPVLRVRLADAKQTWIYINPRSAMIEARYTNRSRYERWLYQGLHDLDFPFLYWHRPAWDATVISLCVGGIALSVTSLVLAFSYLRRWSQRKFGRRSPYTRPLSKSKGAAQMR